MAASQILKNTVATLEVTFSVGNADAAVTVTITRADGTTLVSGGATTAQGAGRYTYALAPQAELDSLTATWTGTFGGTAQSVQTFAEILGGYLFAIADLRAFGDQAITAAKYPDADVRETRNRITDMFEQVCGCSFVPRYARDTVDGTGTELIRLFHGRVSRVISATVDGTALTVPELALVAVRPSGVLFRKSGVWTWGYGGRNVVVAYEHGWPTAPPDISRAALTLARYELVSNDISDRMVAFSSDLGDVRLSVPGTKYPTGIPIVDATLSRYTEPEMLVFC